MAALTLNPTIYATTSTTTLSTTLTATYGQILYLPFPTPLTTTGPSLIFYATLPSPTDPSSKLYLTPLPILVLTELDAVILGPSGSVLQTATIVQGAPPALITLPGGQGQGVDAGAKVYMQQPGATWGGWSKGERGGVIAAGLVVGLVLGGFGWWAGRMIRRRRGEKKKYGETGDAEGGEGSSGLALGQPMRPAIGPPMLIPRLPEQLGSATARGAGGGNSIQTVLDSRNKNVPYVSGGLQDTGSGDIPEGTSNGGSDLPIAGGFLASKEAFENVGSGLLQDRITIGLFSAYRICLGDAVKETLGF